MTRSWKPFAWAAVAMLAAQTDAKAAWNNVFQVTCNCRPAPRTAFFAPAPQAVPQVTYKQRCTMTPVTTYRYQTSYEPVTSYRTSYYWEPVQSYRYTSYYDPCTGCSQRVSTPVTSYRMRSKCDPVTSYVQRCQLVPQTSYRQSCYLEPVAVCAPPPPACPTCGDGAPLPSGGVTEGSEGVAPRGGVTDSPEPARLPGQNLPLGTGEGVKYPPVKPKPSTGLRLDRLASGPSVAGTLVADDRITPRGQTRLVFASGSDRREVKTDFGGRFSADLPTGEWKMYVVESDGKANFHSRLAVEDRSARNVLVVSRRDSD